MAAAPATYSKGLAKALALAGNVPPVSARVIRVTLADIKAGKF